MNDKKMKNQIVDYKKYQTGYKTGIKHLEQIIREEIKNEFRNDKNIYIYDKILVKYNIVEIFVILLSNSAYNIRELDLTFLIIIKEDYPRNPPLIFCLTDFIKNLDIFDVRNIQKNLIPNWDDNIKISDLIRNIPIFIKNIDFQITNKLLPDIGEYYINSLHYDLNDFFLNPNNKFFRAKIFIINDEDSDDIKLKDIFLIITKSNLIILKSCYDNKQNICKIKYIINIIEIKRLSSYMKNDEKLKGLSCFKIILETKTNNNKIKDLVICVSELNLIINQINQLINERKEIIFRKFKYFEKNEKNRITDIEKIIEIKKNIIKNKRDENIFNQIHELYNKLIEISSNKEEEDFSKYVKDFQNFLGTYDNKIHNSDNNNTNEKSIDKAYLNKK